MQFMCYRAELWFTLIQDASLRDAPCITVNNNHNRNSRISVRLITLNLHGASDEHFSDLQNFFCQKLVDTGTRPEGKTEKMGAVRVPIYTGVKCMLSGRIKRVEISKPSEVRSRPPPDTHTYTIMSTRTTCPRNVFFFPTLAPPATPLDWCE